MDNPNKYSESDLAEYSELVQKKEEEIKQISILK